MKTTFVIIREQAATIKRLRAKLRKRESPKAARILELQAQLDACIRRLLAQGVTPDEVAMLPRHSPARFALLYGTSKPPKLPKRRRTLSAAKRILAAWAKMFPKGVK